MKMTWPQPTFLDQFVLHLASRLFLDSEQIESWLRNAIIYSGSSSMSSPPRLYWRSSIFHRADNGKSSDNGDRARSKLGFVDLTFDLHVEEEEEEQQQQQQNNEIEPPAQLRVRFGYFFLDDVFSADSVSSRYIQCKPLTQLHLEMLAKSVGLDLNTGSPQAMALLVAKSLKAISISLCQKVFVIKNEIVDDGLLYFGDAEAQGQWKLPVASTSVLDPTATRLLYFNLPSVDGEQGDLSTVDTSHDVLLERLLVECWERLHVHRLVAKTGTSGAKNGEGDQSNEPQPTELATSRNSAAKSTTIGIKRPAPVSKSGKYVSVVNGTKNRKKKGRITYAKPS